MRDSHPPHPSLREPSWPTSLAVLVFAMAYSSCPRNLLPEIPGFSFNGFSGEYASYFSIRIGTEPEHPTRMFVNLAPSCAEAMLARALLCVGEGSSIMNLGFS